MTQPFDTEVALLGAGTAPHDDAMLAGVRWFASPDVPEVPLWVAVRRDDDAGQTLVPRLMTGFRSSIVPAPAERTIVVGTRALADRIAPSLEAAGMKRRDQTFFGIAAASLAEGRRLPLEPLVGDEAWRDGARVERAILVESRPHDPPNDALLERIVDFKRRQQRDTTPIRRFIARAPDGEPIAMIGYAPFAPSDLGFAPPGVLVRLRDVSVVPPARRRGVATLLLRSIASVAIEECGATQVLIGTATDSGACGLYRKIGARELGTFVSFHGEV